MDSIQVSQSIQHIKNLVIEKYNLLTERDAILQRIRKGSDFFQSAISQDQFIEGSKQFASLALDLRKIENKILDIDTEVIGLLEVKLFNVGIIINNGIGTGANSDLHCVPWKDNDSDKVQITPEDIWLWGKVSKMFPGHKLKLAQIPREEE